MNKDDVQKLQMFLRKKTKPDLTKMCLEKKLSCKGTKHDLAVRLLGLEMRPLTYKATEPRTPFIVIQKNSWGRYVHICSNLVFDKSTRKVIGRQEHDGSVRSLRRMDIQMCKQYKFQYCLPETLDDPEVPFFQDEPLKVESDDDNESDDENNNHATTAESW